MTAAAKAPGVESAAFSLAWVAAVSDRSSHLVRETEGGRGARRGESLCERYSTKPGCKSPWRVGAKPWAAAVARASGRPRCLVCLARCSVFVFEEGGAR